MSMTDIMDKQARSKLMSRIRGRDTKPELALRRALHARGLRFRLNQRKLPGTPDIVLPRWRTAIFVHGCFWHRHAGCRNTTTPSSNVEFWNAKFEANVLRDARALDALALLGWKTAVVWECALRKSVPPEVVDGIVDLLHGDTARRIEIGVPVAPSRAKV